MIVLETTFRDRHRGTITTSNPRFARARQQLYVARLLVPEAKIFATRRPLMQIADENMLDKFTR